MLDGFYFKFTGFNSIFARLDFDTCLNASGGDTHTGYMSVVGNYLDPRDGSNRVIPLPLGLTLGNALEDYIIFTISYPLESNE